MTDSKKVKIRFFTDTYRNCFHTY